MTDDDNTHNSHKRMKPRINMFDTCNLCSAGSDMIFIRYCVNAVL